MLRSMGLFLITVLLTACASVDEKTTTDHASNGTRSTTEQTSGKPGDSAKVITKQIGKTASAPVASMPASAAQSISNPIMAEPVLLMFGKMSAKLDVLAQRQLQQMTSRALQAKHITVTGYCNRKEIRNAEAAAQGRANAVKKELIKQGVPEVRIEIKTLLNEERHAVLIELI